jgi:hypothetical protein
VTATRTVAAPARVAGPTADRSAPTRQASLAAYRAAVPAPAPAALAPPASIAPAPAAMLARWPAPPRPMSSPRLARVEATQESAQNGNAPVTGATPGAPDLDELADYVLERLRHELRDGRERLGFLLDDIR